MPKLYFRYGTMNSSKTMNLLMVADNYEQQGKKVILIKPSIDFRFGTKYITSRTGMKKKANIILDKYDRIPVSFGEDIACVLVDEAQFLTPDQIDNLRVLSLTTSVICYGLRTDYRSLLFPGAMRLMEIADSIEEIKTICTYCSKKSIINMKHVNGRVIKVGDDTPDLGCEEKYIPVCWKCWSEQPEYDSDSGYNSDSGLSYDSVLENGVENYTNIDKELYDHLPLKERIDLPLFCQSSLPDLTVTKEQLDSEYQNAVY